MYVKYQIQQFIHKPLLPPYHVPSTVLEAKKSAGSKVHSLHPSPNFLEFTCSLGRQTLIQ